MYKFEFGFKSDVGKVRKINQDAFFALPAQRLFLVADGVGGHAAGEVASRIAVTSLAEDIRQIPILFSDSDHIIRNKLSTAISNVNTKIYDIANKNIPEGMATTLVALYLGEKSAYIMNVGDSRAYIIRNKDSVQLTEDHTYVNKLVKRGLITPEGALHHPDRNMITRAVGAEESINPDFFKFDIKSDDRILLCTDGLYNEVTREFVTETICAGKDMRMACDELVRAANLNGGNDNITALCVRIV